MYKSIQLKHWDWSASCTSALPRSNLFNIEITGLKTISLTLVTPSINTTWEKVLNIKIKSETYLI